MFQLVILSLFGLQGVTNLKSVDNKVDGTTCACASVNLHDVALFNTPLWDTYQFLSLNADSLLYVSNITRMSHKVVAQQDTLKPTASAAYAVLIGKL